MLAFQFSSCRSRNKSHERTDFLYRETVLIIMRALHYSQCNMLIVIIILHFFLMKVCAVTPFPVQALLQPVSILPTQNIINGRLSSAHRHHSGSQKLHSLMWYHKFCWRLHHGTSLPTQWNYGGFLFMYNLCFYLRLNKAKHSWILQFYLKMTLAINLLILLFVCFSSFQMHNHTAKIHNTIWRCIKFSTLSSN